VDIPLTSLVELTEPQKSQSLYTAKNAAQPVTILMKTSLNNILLPILSLVVNNIVQAWFQQHCYRLGVFLQCNSPGGGQVHIPIKDTAVNIGQPK
jgi:hypothetical protein